MNKKEKSKGAMAPRSGKAAKPSTPQVNKKERAPRNKLVIIIAVLVAAVLIFGIVMLVVGIIRDRDVAMEYDGVYVKRGEAAYLAATFKSAFLSSYGLRDTADAWASEYADGVSWGEVLEQKTEEYIRQVTFGARLFDSIATMSKDNVRLIEDQLLAMLDVQRVSKDYLDTLEDTNGFDFEDMSNASVLLYKNYLAKRLLFGDEGALLEQGVYSEDGYYRDEVKEYFASQYRYVKIAHIRLNEEIVFDDSGNFNPLQSGRLETRTLTDEERSERAALVAELENAIRGGTLTEQRLDEVISEYNKNYDYARGGYYFSATSEAAVEYSKKVSSDVIARVFTMDEGDFALVRGAGIVYVIYRGPLTSEGAFADLAYDDFFGDFYPDAAAYIYSELLVEGMPEIKVKDAYYEIDVKALKPNTDYKLGWLFG